MCVHQRFLLTKFLCIRITSSDELIKPSQLLHMATGFLCLDLLFPNILLFFGQFQTLSLLLSIILRAMLSTRRPHFDSEEGYDGRSRTWEPLLNPQSTQPSVSTKGDGRGTHSDIWSSRIREKVSCF